jgi:universal stress protein A
MAYKSILIAVDLTEEAEEVIAAARNIADGSADTKLAAATIIRPLAGTYGGLDMASVVSGVPFEEEMRSQAIDRLKKLGADNNIDANDTYVRMGTPATEIRSLAEELGADLIVIGTHGRHGLGLLLGSTTNAVLHGITCDVLAVKIHPLED